jgi:hypothetical protein
VSVFLAKRWRQQPQGLLQVDLGNPLAQAIGLDTVWSGTNPTMRFSVRNGIARNSVNNFDGQSVRANAYLGGSSVGVTTTAANSPDIDLGALPSLTEFSIISVFSQGTQTNTFPIAARSSSSTAGFDLLTTGASGGGVTLRTQVNAGGSADAASAALFNDPSSHTYFGTWKSSSPVLLYIDRRANRYITADLSGTITPSQNLKLANRVGTRFSGFFSLLIFGTRQNTDAGLELLDNPWQIFAPQQKPRIFLGLASQTVDTIVGSAIAAGNSFALNENIAAGVGGSTAAGNTFALSQSIGLGVGNAVAGGPTGAAVSVNTSIFTLLGSAAAAGQSSVVTGGQLIGCGVGNAVAAGQRCEILPPLTVAPSATPGYAPRTRYRVRVGSRWMEVDPLDPMSVRRAYDAAQEDAQDAATQDVEAPAAVAAQAVVVQPIKGPDYAGLAKEARRISEDIRKVYADALQTALIARLMREQIERDDEDDIAVLLASI